MVEHLVDARIGEAGELDLGDGIESLRGEPDRYACNGGFGQRCVYDARGAMLLNETLGCAKHAAIDTDILA